MKHAPEPARSQTPQFHPVIHPLETKPTYAFVMPGSPAGRRWPAYTSIYVAELATVGALIVPIAAAIASHLAAIRPPDAAWSLEQGQSRVFIVAALVSLGANIGFGWLSDKTRTGPVGRLPYIPAGAIAGGLCLWQAGQAPTLAGVIVWFALAVFGYNATLAALFGTFADLVHGPDRSRSAGWLAGAANGATVIPLALYAILPVSSFSSFGLFPVADIAITFAAVVVLLPYVRGRRAPLDAEPRSDAIPDAASEVPGWRAQFWLLVVQRGIAQLAFVFAGLYSLLFLVRRVGLDPSVGSTSQIASAAAAAAAISSMITAIAAGYLAARTRNSLAPMRVGLVVMAIGLVAMSFATSTEHFLAAKIAVGLGAGAYLGCDLGLVFRVVPRAQAGRYLGFFNLARSMPQTIAPAIGPLFLAIGAGDRLGVDRSQNYTAFFLAGALISVVALAAMSGLRVRSADTVPEALKVVAPT